MNNKNQLTIDFSEHTDVLESIEQIAKDEVRTTEAQVLYWLVNHNIKPPRNITPPQQD